MAKYVAVLLNGKLHSTHPLEENFAESRPNEIQQQVNGDSFILLDFNQHCDENGNIITNEQPYPSWVWDEEKNGWQPPVPWPQGDFRWDEETLSFIDTPL